MHDDEQPAEGAEDEAAPAPVEEEDATEAAKADILAALSAPEPEPEPEPEPDAGDDAQG